MLRRIDHVQLPCPEGGEPAARRFWAELCQLPEVPKPANLLHQGGCWFEGGGVIVHIGVDRPFTPVTRAHPAFCVADIDALAARFVAGGVTVRWSDSMPGRRSFTVDDPFGNRVEFMADGDGLSQR